MQKEVEHAVGSYGAILHVKFAIFKQHMIDKWVHIVLWICYNLNASSSFN